jgi:hypothetical protein
MNPIREEDPKEVCLIIPIPEPSPHQPPGPRFSKWKRRPTAYPPQALSDPARPKALGLRKPAAAFPEPARWPGSIQALTTSPGPADLPVGPLRPQPFQFLTSHFSPPVCRLFPTWSGRTRLPRATLRVAPTPKAIPSIPSMIPKRSVQLCTLRSGPSDDRHPRTPRRKRPVSLSTRFTLRPSHHPSAGIAKRRGSRTDLSNYGPGTSKRPVPPWHQPRQRHHLAALGPTLAYPCDATLVSFP